MQFPKSPIQSNQKQRAIIQLGQIHPDILIRAQDFSPMHVRFRPAFSFTISVPFLNSYRKFTAPKIVADALGGAVGGSDWSRAKPFAVEGLAVLLFCWRPDRSGIFVKWEVHRCIYSSLSPNDGLKPSNLTSRRSRIGVVSVWRVDDC